jgi:5,5'-dehydrodivanillate O-demethylase oxygenase subunit
MALKLNSMSLSRELNELLTQVGPGTPGGNLLRYYWMPVAPAAEITAERPKKRVRVLGENLVLFRDGAGRFGLIPEQCPHRKCSLYFGFAEDDGLRCPYHGWKFSTEGECIDQPFEPPGSNLKKLAQRPPYKVEQLAGIVFAYLGPEPAPLLPRWDLTVRKDGFRSIVVMSQHNHNWLQAQENSHDPVHPFYLHAGLMKAHGVEEKFKAEVAYFSRPLEGFDFEIRREPGWIGMMKKRIFADESVEQESGNPAIFPNVLFAPHGKQVVIHWRTPVDDAHTNITWLEFTPNAGGVAIEQPDHEIPVRYVPHPKRTDGEYDLTTFETQDQMAWETQGPIVDRETELLGASDRGITMFRKLLRDQIERVRRGEEPEGLIRDPALNTSISFNVSSGQRTMRERLESTTP